MPKPYDRTTYDGRVVDELTKAALEAVAKRLGYDLTLAQGSYNAGGVSASAGTHDGGGVVDLAPYDHENKVRELRRVGFAAWYRPGPPQFTWSPHIHAVLIGNKKLSPSAKAQVAEYIAGYDGLAGDGRDTGPRQFVHHRFRWKTGEQQISEARDLIATARAKLAHGIRGYPGIARARKALGMASARLPKP